MESLAAEATPAPSGSSARLIAIFVTFSKIGLTSFGGGVSVWIHRSVVEHRGWLSESEFSAALAFARVMPGVNIVNLGVLIGHRLRGFGGAVAAVMGLLVGPSLVVIGLAVLYRQFVGSIILDAALLGMAASAAGLLIGMAFKSGGRIVRMGLALGGRGAAGQHLPGTRLRQRPGRVHRREPGRRRGEPQDVPVGQQDQPGRVRVCRVGQPGGQRQGGDLLSGGQARQPLGGQRLGRPRLNRY